MNASSPNVSDAATVLRAFHRTEGWWWREEGVETAWKSLGTALLTTPSIRQHKRTNPFSAALLLRGRNRTSSGIVSERREKSRRRVHTHTHVRTEGRQNDAPFFVLFFCFLEAFTYVIDSSFPGCDSRSGMEPMSTSASSREEQRPNVGSRGCSDVSTC